MSMLFLKCSLFETLKSLSPQTAISENQQCHQHKVVSLFVLFVKCAAHAQESVSWVGRDFFATFCKLPSQFLDSVSTSA